MRIDLGEIIVVECIFGNWKGSWMEEDDLELGVGGLGWDVRFWYNFVVW